MILVQEKHVQMDNEYRETNLTLTWSLIQLHNAASNKSVPLVEIHRRELLAKNKAICENSSSWYNPNNDKIWAKINRHILLPNNDKLFVKFQNACNCLEQGHKSLEY